MNNEDILSKKVGQNEVPRNTIEPARVKIVQVVIMDKTKAGKKMSMPILQFFVKHPDKEEPLAITKMKILEGNKLNVRGFWVQVDKEGNFYQNSTIDEIMKFLKIEKLSDASGLEIDTVLESNENPYLCLKAY